MTGEAPDYRQAVVGPGRGGVGDRGGRRDGDWFDLGVTVAVDGEDIPFAQLFAALAADEEFLLLPSGTWFDVRRPEFHRLRALIDEARALQDADRPGLRISRYQAGLWEELVELGVVDEQSERWARDVRAAARGGRTPAPPAAPAGLDAELRPYQLEGFHWLLRCGTSASAACSPTTWGWARRCRRWRWCAGRHEAGELTAPVLVVAPTSVVSNWAREAARFAPGLRVRTDRGDRPQARHGAGRGGRRARTWWSPRTRCCGWGRRSTGRCRGAGWCSTRRSS